MHAKRNGCFFEINSSPDRLDLSADNARLAREAGVKIAISTDAHSVHEFATIQYGIEQARRAGLEKTFVLNCTPLDAILSLFKRQSPRPILQLLPAVLVRLVGDGSERASRRKITRTFMTSNPEKVICSAVSSVSGLDRW
jgi:hypothetical protein